MKQAELTAAEDVMVRIAEIDPLVAMLERVAANPDVDVAKLERLIAMQERILDRNAQAAFDAAFADMQAEIPAIAEKSKTDKAWYAPLEDIVETVRPILHKHGFALSHSTSYPDPKRVKVVGILTHRQGYARRSEFEADADTSGSKNAIQALGSSTSYGRRYTTMDLLGITTRRADDDGQAGQPIAAGEAPAGFTEFVDGLSDAATEGTPALMAAFNKGAKPLRDHLMKAGLQRWNSLKGAAAQVKS